MRPYAADLFGMSDASPAHFAHSSSSEGSSFLIANVLIGYDPQSGWKCQSRFFVELATPRRYSTTNASPDDIPAEVNPN